MENGQLSEKLRNARVNRRDLLRRATLLGLTCSTVGSLLAACGGDDDDDDATPTATAASTDESTPPGVAAATPTTDTVAPSATAGSESPTATTSADTAPTTEAVAGQRGGVFSGFEAGNPTSLDPYLSGSQLQASWSSYSYSRLFMSESGPGVPRGSLETVPDAAASVEAAEDGLSYTIALKDNVYWHPPLDRLMTADDVVWAWSRFTGTLPGSTVSDRYSDRVNFITTCEKIDDTTVVFTLTSPYPFFLAVMADPKVFFIMPPEMESQYNPAETVIGTGPWVLAEYTPDNRAIFDRHPKWHFGPDLPYFDQAIVNIVPEYATQLSQFLGGNLDVVTVQGSDLARVLDEVDGVQIYERPAYPLAVLNFSPNEERWRDERLRRAVSMAIDRDAMLDAAYGIPEIEESGIEVPRYWHNFIPAAFTEYWLDPKGDEIDPEVAVNFRYDPDAAKALVDEAGGGFDTEFHYAAANSRYGEPYRIMSELMIQYLGQIGINATALEEDYNTRFLGENGTSSGNFNGMFWIPQTRTDPYSYIITQYLSPNSRVYGQWNDDELTEAANAIRTIQDPDQLKQAIKDFQNLAGRKMYIVPMQYGAAPTYVAYQPWVENALDYQTFAQGGATEALPFWWSNR
jgi:peptide/nickel transport system substrate-binding protein